MPTTPRKPRLDDLDRAAGIALNSLYAKSASKGRKAGKQSAHSWKAVAVQLGQNQGYIYGVAHGTKRASNTLLLKLGLHLRSVTIPACPKCGKAHTQLKQCAPRATPARPRKNWKRMALVFAGLWATLKAG